MPASLICITSRMVNCCRRFTIPSRLPKTASERDWAAFSANTQSLAPPNRDSGLGAAYVFRVDTGQWVAKIPNPNPTKVGAFGSTILEVPGGFLVAGFNNQGGVFLYQIPEPTAALLAGMMTLVAAVAHRELARTKR